VTFWDHLKPATRAPSATAVEVSPDQQVLQIAWDDGKKTSAKAQLLRQVCPCAECVDEWTHQRRVDPASVPADLKILQVHPVGNYALNFTFGDAHQTGIFNWGFLREVSERPASG
jgi:DUF971 family protein